jgi:hypothetical protein
VESAASFYCQVGHCSQICFATIIYCKISKLLKTQQLLKLEKKINTALELFEFFGACLIKFKNNQILLIKISHRFLLTTKLFTRLKQGYVKEPHCDVA